MDAKPASSGRAQGRNQERANRAFAPPPRNFCKRDGIHVLHTKSYFSKLRKIYVHLFSRQFFRKRFCCIIWDT